MSIPMNIGGLELRCINIINEKKDVVAIYEAEMNGVVVEQTFTGQSEAVFSALEVMAKIYSTIVGGIVESDPSEKPFLQVFK